MACVREVLERAGRRHVGHARCARGWNVQQMNAVKPPVSSCKLPQPLQVLDALGERLDVAEHHGAGRSAAQFVPDAMDLEPFVGQAPC